MSNWQKILGLDAADGDKDRVVNVIERIVEERERSTWNKFILPILYIVIFVLVGAIALMIWEFKGIEMVVIVSLMFALFLSTTLLVLTGKLGFQLALLNIQPLRKKAGDFWNIQLMESGGGKVSIDKHKDFIHFPSGHSARVQSAHFHEESTGLPMQISVENSPLTIDPRDPYTKEPLVRIANQLKSLSSIMISIFHLGRIKGQEDLTKMLKYVMYIFYGVILLGVLMIGVLYLNMQVTQFFDEHGKDILDAVSAAKDASAQYLATVAAGGKTILEPAG